MKGKFKRVFSAFLAAAMVFTSIPVSAGEVPTPVVLEEQQMDESIIKSGMFYISSPASEVQENASSSSIFRVQRGGINLPATKVVLNIMDLTAKYGEDYKIKIYQNSLFGEKVQGAGKSQSLLEQILEGEDNIVETNETDVLVNGENALTDEEKQELYEEDVETLKDALGISDEEVSTEEADTEEVGSEEVNSEEAGTETDAAEEDLYAEEVEKDPSLSDLKELATGLPSDKQPMDGGDLALDKDVADMLSSMTIDLNSAYLNLEFAEGETEKWIEIIPKDNKEGDGDRSFQMFLATDADNAVISSHSGITVTIVDDEEQEDAVVSFAAGTYVPEKGYIEVVVKREGAINQVVMVDMYTEDGTAKSSRDYSLVDTTITFPYGIKERTIKIPIRSEYVSEEAEFKIILSNPVNGIIGETAEAKGLIRTTDQSVVLTEVDKNIDSNYKGAAATVGSDILGKPVTSTKNASKGSNNNTAGFTKNADGTWQLHADSNVVDWTYAQVEWYDGVHYDYSGWQIKMTDNCGTNLPYYGDTTFSAKNAATGQFVEIGSTDGHFSSKTTTFTHYFNFDRVGEVQLKVYQRGALFGAEAKYTVHSVTPVLRPFEVSLVEADPLYFLDENGQYIKNTEHTNSDVKKANKTALANVNADNVAVLFSGNKITVSIDNAFAYIKGLRIVNKNTNESKIILNNLKVGTTSASIQLTNDFITKNLDYINFTGNGSNGRKGQFAVQAILGYYDTTITVDKSVYGDAVISNYGTIIPGETYRIKNQYSGLYLTGHGATKDITVQQADTLGFDLWTVQEVGDGYFLLINEDGNQLNIPYDLTADGSRIDTDVENGHKSKHFALKRYEDGSYGILTKTSDQASGLTLASATKAEGTKVQLYKNTNDGRSKWVFERVIVSDTQQVIPGETYRIKNKYSGLYLTGHGRAQSVTVEKSASNGLDLWTVQAVGDGYFILVNGDDLQLNIPNDVTADGSRIDTEVPNGHKSKHFALKRYPDGSYGILTKTSNQASGLTLASATTNTGTKVQLYKNTNDERSQWIFENVTSSDTQLYQIKNVNSGKYLVNQYSDKAGTIRQNSSTNDARSYWSIQYTSDGYCTLVNGSGAVLDVTGGNKNNGALLQTYEANNTDSQKFTLKKQSDGSYIIFTKLSGNKKCVGVSGASKDNNALVVQHDANGSKDQQWMLVPVNESDKDPVIPGATYRIRSQYNNHYLTGHGEWKDVNVEKARTDGSDLWTVIDAGNGYYILQNANGYQLNIPYNSTADGAQIDTAPANGHDSKLFALRRYSDGSYGILSKASNQTKGVTIKAVTFNAGDKVHLLTHNPNAEPYKWIFERVSPDDTQLYQIKNVNSGKYLVNAYTDKKGNVNQNPNTNDARSYWKIQYTSDGYAQLVNESGFVLDVSGGSSSNGARLQTWENCKNNAQKFTFKEQSDGSYIILTKVSGNKKCIGVSGAVHDDNAWVVQWDSNGSKDQQWILEPVTYDQMSVQGSIHKGDTLVITQTVDSAYTITHTGSRVHMITKKSSDDKYTKNSLELYNGKSSYTFLNEFSQIQIKPNFEKKDNTIVVRVLASEDSKFDKNYGIFASAESRTETTINGKAYVEYQIYSIQNDTLLPGRYYEMTAVPKTNGYVAVWTPVVTNESYSQETFHHYAYDKKEDNVITLTLKKADTIPYSLSASIYSANVKFGTNKEGEGWLPGIGAYVVIGSRYYGISDKDGNVRTVPMLGINGYKLIYKVVASGKEEYKTLTLSNKKTVDIEITDGVKTKVYDMDLGKITISSINREVAHMTSINAVNGDSALQAMLGTDQIAINDQTTQFVVKVKNNGIAYTDTDGTKRYEHIIAINLVVCDSQTHEQKLTIECLKENADGTWRGSYVFEKVKEGQGYSDSDELYVQIITDRVIGNGKSPTYDKNNEYVGVVENAALQKTVYPLVNSGYTFFTTSTEEPVTQDITLPTESFVELPLIGDVEVSLDIEDIGLSISTISNGVRLSIGYEVEEEDGSESNEPEKSALEQLQELGHELGNDPAGIGMKSWGIKPTFGFFLDFRVKQQDANPAATKELVFDGGGLVIGIKGKFQIVEYFMVSVVPCYFGIEGSTELESTTTFKTENATVKPEDITKVQGGFEENFTPVMKIEMKNNVTGYVGAGLCGTLGVRGGISFDANFVAAADVAKDHQDWPATGIKLSADIKAWIDAAVFTIEVSENLAEKEFGLYKYWDPETGDVKSVATNKKASPMMVSETTGHPVYLKDRTSLNAQWNNKKVRSTFLQEQTMMLINNSYDRADAQLLELGDGRILLAFVGDAGSTRDSQNRTAVMYSVYENGNWSEPVVVQNDTTADFEPNLTDAGDKVLLTWTSRNTDEEDTPSDYLRSMEVYAAMIDKATLKTESIERLTTDDYYDSAPVGLYDETTGDMLVYYLKSEVTEDFETSVSPTKNESMIVYMLYDASQNQWARTYYYDNEVDDPEAEEILVEYFGGQRFLSSPLFDFGVTEENPDGIIDPVIVDFDAISYNGLGVYTFTVDEDNNMDTAGDRELFVQAYDFEGHMTYVPIRITNDNITDARPQLVRNGDNTYLFWLQNEQDICYLNVSDLVKNGVADDGTIREDYNLLIGRVFFNDDDGESINPTFGSYEAYVDQDDNLFITWLQPVTDEDGSNSQEVFASAFIHSEEGSTWSSGVQLTESGAFNDEVAFVTDNKGNLIMVNNQYQMDLSTSDCAVTESKLVFTKFETVGSMEVKEVVYSDNTPLAGEDMEVQITVKNTGLKPAEGYTMKVYEVINGKVGETAIYESTYEGIVTPSSDNVELMTWTMPKNLTELEKVSLYITVQETNMKEVSKFTSESVDIKPEYELSDCVITEELDGFYATYTITNTGNVSANIAEDGTGDVVVIGFHDLYNTGKEYAAFMEALIGDLAPGMSDTVTMPLSIPDEAFTYGYTNAYMIVEDADGNALTKVDVFEIALKFPYKIVINDDENLEIITIKEGETLALSGKYSPNEYYVNGNILFATTDDNIASVDADGTLIANTAGTTKLKATILPFGGEKTIEVVVEPIADEDEPGDTPSDDPSDEPNDNPSDEPSDEPSDRPGDGPSDEPGEPDVPSTGDNANMVLWMTILGIGIVTMASAIAGKKRTGNN